ncbi:MAG TPA: hypothetical protein VNR36_06480 [Pseudolysinimonas sp.]|nr:hypothetical protein [Pseudolysinimonas sp.]
MAEQQRRRRSLRSRIDIGIGLISFSVLIIAVALTGMRLVADTLGFVLLIAAAALVLIAVLWTAAVRNSRAERTARLRLQREHPGALVERVRLWTLPAGRVDPHLPTHFIVADAQEISFETLDQTALLRIPVERLGFVDPVRAQQDRARDRALTLIYEDEDGVQQSVQLFSVTGMGLSRLRHRIRTAIGWPADGDPGPR